MSSVTQLKTLCLCASGAYLAVTAHAQWPCFAADPARSSIARRAPRDLDGVAWQVAPLTDEEFIFSSTPVAAGGRVYVLARHFEDQLHDENRLIAFAADDGERMWTAPIAADTRDSWSSPAVDLRTGLVIACADEFVYGVDLDDGSVVWTRALNKEIVNASPLVTSDLTVNGTPANRVFITDYTGTSANAKLYAINIDPFHSSDNPHQPGAIAWSVSLPNASGNSPAYADQVVYVSSRGGLVKALDARSGGQLWQRQIDLSGYPPLSGFFGGITLRNGALYLAMYVFTGGENNAAIFKLDAATGDIVWSAPAERSSSTPVVLDDGRVFLSGGIDGDFGSYSKIQAFQDQGAFATQLWDTHVDSGGSLVVGGWTDQPVYFRERLYAGRPGMAPHFSAFDELYALDLTRQPGEAGFVTSKRSGAGGPAAAAHGRLYSVGADGLVAFNPSPECLADLNGDGQVNVADLSRLLEVYGSHEGDGTYDAECDLDLDGTIGIADLSLVLSVYGAVCP
ncbi:MAG: PQQ-binding-like beta-propeller repeat protein [Phycisphaerae bacterium]|jgi:outer membrane protein assembly factor BamB